MTITAYKSPYTGELFESEEEFEKHIASRREYEEKHLREEQRRNKPRLTATSIEDFLTKTTIAINSGLVDQLWKIEGIILEKTVFDSVEERYKATIKIVFNTKRNSSYVGFVANFPGIDVNDKPYVTEATVFILMASFHLANFPLIREKFLRLEELKKERDQYVIEVKEKKEKACAEDIMITELNSKHFYVSNQIDVLRAELVRIQNQLGIHEKEHEDRIVKENPFEAYEEYKELYEKFKTN